MEPVQSSIRRHPWIAGPLSLIVPGLGQLYNVQYARAVWAAGIMVGLDVVAAVAFVSVPPARFALVEFLVLITMSELIARLVFAVDAVFGARRNRLVSPGRHNRIPVYLAFFFGVGLLQVAPGILAMFTIGLRMEIYSMASPSGYPNVLARRLCRGLEGLLPRSRAAAGRAGGLRGPGDLRGSIRTKRRILSDHRVAGRRGSLR